MGATPCDTCSQMLQTVNHEKERANYSCLGLEDTYASNTSALSRLPTLPTLPTSDCVLADLLKPVTVVFEVTKDMRAPSADGFLPREQRHVRSHGASNCGVERRGRLQGRQSGWE